MKILVIHGPNLNLLGTRESDIYGKSTLKQIDDELVATGKEKGAEVVCYQSNHEGELVDQIQQHGAGCDGIVINAGAYTHTSVAIRDALLAVGKPFVEVHISNIFKREEFRHGSYLSDAAVGMITGLGPGSYRLGLLGLIETLGK